MADRSYVLAQNSGKTFGHLNLISGLVFESGGGIYIALTPSATIEAWSKSGMEVEQLNAEEWSQLISYSDNPVFLDHLTKIFLRKTQFEISGVVQQKVWVRDGLKCMYCQKPMGEVQLSVDHFVPLELGGENNDKNYISACRKCNKNKGNMTPQEWCTERNLSYDFFVDYLKNARIR